MSRSGYHDDCDNDWAMIRWRGAVASSTRGKRGQKLLKDLAEALDAMPVKELIVNSLKTETGSVCALGALADRRGLNVDNVDPHCPEEVADLFDIAEPLAREIVYKNDEHCDDLNPPERWAYMRKWVQSQIKDRK